MKIDLIPFQKHGDERGMLVALEQAKNVPFEIKRVYYMFGTQTNVRRGYHAHKKLRQLAIPVSGSCRFHLDNGLEKIDILLDDASQGLLIEPSVWHEMYDYSSDCILLVLASDAYDESDYIRSYDEFLASVKI
ncbi:sugar 3,4-ketoisomerase [Enterobacter hormaechei]|uniref:sugar 3,4-ketoisomerase n=1 Tax=Enterobacter cloacae complex TaxID=354276 RepID=UPI001886C668|nr:FdtA/QdtA family cupin domain-containing protein [Enterobacter hormaechei]EKZ9487297.1 WxcM-like domain-containing protein [Enterobacter hormaechei]MBF1949278.1 WxcM-like domain-containing protein [Enterobacter hormaechei]MCE1404196.1 FdtA/QdtA family cupin domain-containing protein [Enterobacter hormaechei]MCM7058147.1 FdtA/QdtA family cupin domain-containing protein [Enterobacter hormaechei]MCV2341767.1 FdtA/QdtA family cupin domain-containing protein [Enterobacter hormaechei]